MKTHRTRSEYIERWMSQGDDVAQARPTQHREQAISIIGMDGVFPGCANIGELWQALLDERTLHRVHPAGYLHGRPDRSDGSQSFVAGLIEPVFDFDPRFFKISNSEAALMDPQLRHLLMSAQRSIEDAGYTSKQLAAHRVGVFIGSEGSEYNDLNRAAAVEAGYSLNQAGCSLAHRLSYHFDFKGPSEVIDTLCSSGAYSIYRAMQLLRDGEIDVAIVGAVKLYFSEQTFRVLNDLKMTSRSQCHSFHRNSDGYVRSEGVVTLVLKSAAAALRDRDHVYANIVEAAVTYNGRDGNSMFTPGRRGQKEAIQQCYRRAGIQVADVAYIEAQGMGNEISDLVEFNAINEACEELVGEQGSAAARAGRFPVISTLKPVLGHMECVSALGALLRIVLSFRTRTLYRIPRLSREDINEKLDAASRPCKLLTAHQPIQAAQIMRAGLNSFGASGTNVHLLLEQPAEQTQSIDQRDRTEHLLILSAQSQKSLLQYVRDVHRYLSDGGVDVSLHSLCRTYQSNRDHHAQRVIFHVRKADRDEQIRCLKENLARYLQQDQRCESAWDNRGGLHDHRASVVAESNNGSSSELLRDGLAWLGGATIDWARIHNRPGELYKRGGLPTYPFDVKACKLPMGPGLEETSREASQTVPARAMAAGSVHQIIVATLAKSLQMNADEISHEAPFADYGVDSVTGVNLVQTLNESLGIELEMTVLFDNSTVNRLAAYVATRWPDRRTTANDRATDKTPAQNTARAGREPIAIVGMSGRFAGCETLDELWHGLRDGKDMVTEATRWPAADCVTRQGSCTRGSFVESIDRFDPFFFNISPLEALYMDPQQRLFLEECWKALEDAGYAGKNMDGRRCGVYTGCNFTDYTALFDEEPPEQAFWGVAGCVIPARIAYYLNLQGPAVMVDTACSSSLVAMHVACQGLWSGETEMALAGAVFLQVTPMFFRYSNRAGMLSAQGRCATFDADADGFVPGEGVGVVVLKRLQDALRDGDTIHGVIAGSAINQDGKTNGITAPSARSQEELECTVYDSFGIHPETLQVVEAHGTGTRLGDPIEFGAISRAFSRYTDQRGFCAIGSIKTNIGHASAAAGMAGVLKLLLALKHRQIPPSLHFKAGNPLIDFDASPFYVNTQLREWPVQDGAVRRAAINSFGFSGTNAHMVIEEAPAPRAVEHQAAHHLIVLSGCTREQLRQQVENLVTFARDAATLSMSDMAHTLLVGRMHRGHRLSCIAHSQAELIEVLERWLQTGAASRVATAEIQEGKVQTQPALQSRGESSMREAAVTMDVNARLEHLAVVADLYLQGQELDFRTLFPTGARRIPLPTYPFARERYWLDGAAGNVSSLANEHQPLQSFESIEALIQQIDDGAIEAHEGAQRLRALV